MASAPVDPELRRGTLRRMAQWGLLLTLLIVVLSAFVRQRGVGLGCEDWPACYGQDLARTQSGEVVAAGEDVLLARLAHRVVASVTLVLVIAMVLAALGARPALRRAGTLALAMLAIALGLAVLGVVTPGSRLPAVALGNLLGGFAMFALSARLVTVTGTSRPADAMLARAAILVAILLVLQVTLGAMVSATHSGLSCRALAECLDLTASGGWNFALLDPWRLPPPGSIASGAAGAPLQLAHRVGSIVAAAAVLALSLLAWRRGRRRRALALAGLLLGVVTLGLFFVGAGKLPLPAVLLHNLGAVSLLALVGVTGLGPAASAIGVGRQALRQ